MADLDPLNLTKLDPIPELDPKRYGIDEKDGKSYHLAGIVHIGKSSDPSISREKASIDRILSHLKNSYTGRIGFEFAHLPVFYLGLALINPFSRLSKEDGLLDWSKATKNQNSLLNRKNTFGPFCLNLKCLIISWLKRYQPIKSLQIHNLFSI